MFGRLACVIPFCLGLLIALTGTAYPATANVAPSPAQTRLLTLPIPPGQTWYVCQGYNGELTHGSIPALDFSLAPQSAGSKGCIAGSKYSSAGSIVSAPAAGIAYRWPGCCGDDFVCVNFDSGGSAAIGHLSNRVPSGTRVRAGGRIGTVSWPDRSNGDYAHVHAQVHVDPDCTEGSEPVAFDVAHGFRWACTPDLPYSGSPNQYSGLAVTRCASDGRGEEAPGATDELDAGIGGPSWVAMMITRSLRVIGVSFTLTR